MPTIRLSDTTWEKFEEGCVEATIIRRKPVNVAEVVKYIIDENLESGIEKFLEIEKEKKKLL